MSESYISDKAPTVFKDNARTAADDRYARLSIVQQIESEIGLGVDGSELNFATAQRLKRLNIATMSPVELFKFQLVRKYRQLYDIKDSELLFLNNLADEIPNIQFKNTGGMLYAYRLVNAVNTIGSQKEIKDVVADAKEKAVPVFDIFRYYRLLEDFDKIPKFSKAIKFTI
jgi:hypothetical protein